MVPVSDSRVLTGCCDKRRENVLHRPIKIDLHHIAAELAFHFGQILRGMMLQFLQIHAVLGDLAEHLTVGGAGHAKADGQ